MSDPVSSYRNTCRNAPLMLGGDPARVRGEAAVQLARSALDGVRQHRLDATTGRAAYAEGNAAMRHLPPDLQAQLAPLLSQLDTQVSDLERAGRVHQDHGAPAARQTAHAPRHAAPAAATIAAGLSPSLASHRGSELHATIQQTLFTDGPQTTRTLRALASLSPAALRETVTARVGAHAADAVLDAISGGARMQFRVRVSERAHDAITRTAQRLEDRSTGAGLDTTLAALRGPGRGPVIAQLAALGVSPARVHALVAEDASPEARHALRTLVADATRDGAETLRAFAQRYDAAHNVLDATGQLYTLLEDSVRQTRAQLGVPVDPARSALGRFIEADIAEARANQRVNDVSAFVAGVVATVALAVSGVGVAADAVAIATRGTASSFGAADHADDVGLAALAGETTREAADDARAHARIETAITVGAGIVGLGAGVLQQHRAAAALRNAYFPTTALREAAHHAAHVQASLTGGAVETAIHGAALAHRHASHGETP